MNLLVAKSVPSLADLDLSRYQQQADQWAHDVRQRLPAAEQTFRQTPWEWRDDVNFLRLGVLCGYLEYEAGIAYNEDQRDGGPILYTDPSDLFLNGVMDTRRGTCGNMAALHVALGWRLDWPVSLACVGTYLYFNKANFGACRIRIDQKMPEDMKKALKDLLRIGRVGER